MKIEMTEFKKDGSRAALIYSGSLGETILTSLSIRHQDDCLLEEIWAGLDLIYFSRYADGKIHRVWVVTGE